MADKTNKLKARLPPGLSDRGPAEIAATRRMTEAIREVYERYGFDPVETPAIEYTDALGKFLPDLDRPNEGVFSFQDDDEQWMSLRYDLTAPLARYVAENFQKLALPYRSYRFGWVFRNEKPGAGRFRQFMQFDADTVGSGSPAADAEICMMAADTMEALGIARGQYVVKVNNRKIFDGVLDALGFDEKEEAGRRLAILRAVDKADKFPLVEIEKLLGPGRKDESGDYTRGAQLSPFQIERVVSIIAPRQETERLFKFYSRSYSKPFTVRRYAEYLDRYFGLSTLPPRIIEGLEELDQIRRLVRACRYGPDRIRIDPTVVRGLEYYTGPVYEVELLLDTKDEKGRPVRFGSVGGGGRYDGLVSRFRGQPVPATGFSIGVSRLQAALTLIGKLDNKSVEGPVLVTIFDHHRTADYQKMVAELRENGIRAELYLGSRNHNLAQQLKYADKRGSPCAIIQGSDEKATGEILIKDLFLGAELAKLENREEYLRKQADAQRKVPEGKLVEAVREVLARHSVTWN